MERVSDCRCFLNDVVCLCLVCRVKRGEALGDGAKEEVRDKKEDGEECEAKRKCENERRKRRRVSDEGHTELLRMCMRCDPFEK